MTQLTPAQYDAQSCDCPVCTATIWDRSTGYQAPLDPKPEPKPEYTTSWFWRLYAWGLVAAALGYALRALMQ